MEESVWPECISDISVTFWDRDEEIKELLWNQHPMFNGVSLRHLITGKDTDGKLSCHVVRIDPHCSLEEHFHESQWETHQVISGTGFLRLANREIAYHPGQVAVIPKGMKHKVVASNAGLVLHATFFPALV